MALELFKFSPLPNPPDTYDAVFFRQFLRTLEIYFSKLDALTPNHAQSYRAEEFFGGGFYGDNMKVAFAAFASMSAKDFLSEGIISNTLATSYVTLDALMGGNGVFSDLMVDNLTAGSLAGDGYYIEVPTGQFTSSASQTAASTTAAYALQFDASTLLNDVSLVSSTRITFARAGVYKMAYAVQFHSPVNNTEVINIWLSKNGTNIALSNHKYSIPARKSVGQPAHLLATGFSFVEVAAADYVEIMWNVSDITVIVEPSVASGSPSIPATPSADVSVEFVSAAAPPTIYIRPITTTAFALVGTAETDA
jgi:hypothetical protein